MSITHTRFYKFTRSPLFTAGLLFIMALLIRLPALNTFLTIDEFKWVEGAVQFLSALHTGNLAQTYWHFFPGITTTWLEALLLWLNWLVQGNNVDLISFATTKLENLGHIIGLMRLSQVFITALIISGVYLLARPLAGNAVALLGSALLALDPFYLSHSRVVNGDAGAAGFMLLSVLAFLWLYQGSGLRIAILSGVMGGLAILTKLPAPIIVPWIGILALAGYFKQKQAAFWIKAIILWGVSAAFVFILLWPAMWVAPLSTLQQMYHDTFEIGEAGEGHDTFFMGQISNDPGWLFYPVAIAFRLTPVTTIGLLAVIIWLFFIKSKDDNTLSGWLSWSLVAYILFIIITANFSAKKLDRYVMAVFPALNLLIAIGLWGLWRRLTITKSRTFKNSGLLFIALIIALQGIFALINYPYLLTGYNPLMGGTSQAATMVPVGWGEGLEQAALYLNELPQAELLSVSSWYSDIFQPYFVGKQASFSDDGRGQLSADYVVFYINQIQRQKPYSGLIDYFRTKEPVFILDVSAIDKTNREPARWVEVYKSPAAQSASGAPKVEGVAQLLAYKIEGNRVATETSDLTRFLSENELFVTLYLRVLGPLPSDTTLRTALTSQDLIWGQWQSTTTEGEWIEGNVIEWQNTLTLPPHTPSDQYKLWVAFQFEDGSIIAEFPISEKDPPVILE